MAKGLLTIIGSCLCLIFSLQTNTLYAASQGNPVNMQEHIEKVKSKNPAGYQEMVDKAGGNITNCLSCHIDMNKKKNVSGQTNPR
jgi:cytochrome c